MSPGSSRDFVRLPTGSRCESVLGLEFAEGSDCLIQDSSSTRGLIGLRILFCSDQQLQINRQLFWTWKAADVKPWTSGVKQTQGWSSDGAKKVDFSRGSREPMPVELAEYALGSSRIQSLYNVVREDSEWVDV